MKVRLKDQELLFQASALGNGGCRLPDPLYRLAEVSFNQGGQRYTYLCEDKSVEVEDWSACSYRFW